MTTDPKDLPLTDPREIRKLLTEVAYTGRQIEAMGKWPKNLQKYVDDHVNI